MLTRIRRAVSQDDAKTEGKQTALDQSLSDNYCASKQLAWSRSSWCFCGGLLALEDVTTARYLHIEDLFLDPYCLVVFFRAHQSVLKLESPILVSGSYQPIEQLMLPFWRSKSSSFILNFQENFLSKYHRHISATYFVNIDFLL